jgi:hypothetical protein
MGPRFASQERPFSPEWESGRFNTKYRVAYVANKEKEEHLSNSSLPGSCCASNPHARFFAAAQYAPVSTKLLRRGIRSLAPNRSKWRLQMARERDNCPASRRGSKDPTWQRHADKSTNQLEPKALVLHGTHVSLRNIARVHWRCWTASGRSMFALLGTDHPGSYRAGCTL